MSRWSGNARFRLSWILLGVGSCLGVGLLFAWWLRVPAKDSTSRPSPTEAPTGPDPRSMFTSPYRNARPEVAYVGDEVCSSCHPGQAETYHRHPMSRSLAPVQRAPVGERFDESAGNPFFALGFRYRVEGRGDQVIHEEAVLDDQGRVVAAQEAEVYYAVGSSRRGRSYLINRDGRLFQSPITWYPQRQRWDLSPSYAQRNHHFARPVTADCLFCHSNRVLDVKGTLNGFAPPIFQGYAIGCERCHGPGELHVRRQEQAEVEAGPDDTIVNPRRLPPDLREAVCQQCHLQGQYRVVRYGRQTFDYRPGLPLAEFLSVFVRPSSTGEAAQFVGQAEQMALSRCYQASQGALGCISCHDPHELPSAEQRVHFYRERCLSCHASQGCSLPEPARRQKSPEDSCIDCHMPRRSTEVPHTAVSDHRIPRQTESMPSTPPARLAPGEIPLVLFPHQTVRPNDTEVGRDLAVALIDRVERFPRPVQQALASRLLPWLEAARAQHTDDIDASHAQAVVLSVVDRRLEAAELFEQILRAAPRREVTLHAAAALAMEMGRFTAAEGYWERALAVNPYRYEFHYGLAAALAERRAWGPAAAACRRALELQIAALPVRQLLVRCYLELGEAARAQEEFARLLALNPPDPEGLRRWFRERAEAGRR